MAKMTASEAGKLGWLKGKECRDRKKKTFRKIYRDNPNKCKNCDAILSFDKRHNKYCNHSCAAQQTNLGVTTRHGRYKKTPCIRCKTITKNPKFCGSKCQHLYCWEKLKQDIAQNGFDNLSPFSHTPKKYLIEVRGRKCEICGITEWMGQQTPINLDHINGNSNDWSLDNLRLICPNCDAQTPTYAGRNRGNGRHYRRERYKQGKSS